MWCVGPRTPSVKARTLTCNAGSPLAQRTSEMRPLMSAFRSKADLARTCGDVRLSPKADMTEFREVFPASALLEPTLDQSVSAFTGGAYTVKSSQEAHYGRSEQT